MRAYIGLMLLGLGLAPAHAQTLGPPARDIEAVERQARVAAERQAQLAAQATKAQAQAQAIAARAVAIAARIQANETQATAIEGRIATLEAEQRAQRARLAAAQGKVVPLLTAIETLSRRPRALLIVQPGRTADAARITALLDAVLPVMRARTADLRREIANSRALRQALERERQRLAQVAAQLTRDARALAAAEAAQLQLAGLLSTKADEEAERAARLAANAQSLRGLLDRLARHDRRGGAVLRSVLRVPVSGQLTVAYGVPNSVGVHARGVSFATRPGAQVVAPAAGRVAFAGPFRTYGRIVILEHDDGRLSLLAGLGSVSVAAGHALVAGAPIGRMGPSRPELYFELRDAGTPVDPMRHLTTWPGASSQ